MGGLTFKRVNAPLLSRAITAQKFLAARLVDDAVEEEGWDHDPRKGLVSPHDPLEGYVWEPSPIVKAFSLLEELSRVELSPYREDDWPLVAIVLAATVLRDRGTEDEIQDALIVGWRFYQRQVHEKGSAADVDYVCAAVLATLWEQRQQEKKSRLPTVPLQEWDGEEEDRLPDSLILSAEDAAALARLGLELEE